MMSIRFSAYNFRDTANRTIKTTSVVIAMTGGDRKRSKKSRYANSIIKHVTRRPRKIEPKYGPHQQARELADYKSPASY